MTTLAIATGGLLGGGGGGGGVTLPSLLDISVGATMSADVSLNMLAAQVNQGLVISVAETIIGANVQSSLSVELNTIRVEVDIC
jgi:hypothetical protein